MYKFFKRAADIFAAALGLAVCLPFFPLVWLIVKIDSPGKFFFKQQRVGRDEKLFGLYKIRSMSSNAPANTPTHLLTGSHVTRVGKIFRKLSIDELPQLWNILVGDMSVIGPRPALWNQDDLVAERRKYGANAVRPGLTGLAQISGRDELEIPVKAKLDGEYAQTLGFITDLKIFFGSFKVVLIGRGVRE